MKAFVLSICLTFSYSIINASQQYEALSASTATILSNSISSSFNYKSSFKNLEEEKVWIDSKDKVLSRYIKDKTYRNIVLKNN